jgi:hypothetical protein
MMHSTTFRVVGAILVLLALFAFLFRGTFLRTNTAVSSPVVAPATK